MHTHLDRLPSLVCEADVFWFQIPVHDARLVHRIDRIGHLRKEAHRLRLLIRTALLDRAQQIAARDQLHRQVDAPGRAHNLAQPDDARVLWQGAKDLDLVA